MFYFLSSTRPTLPWGLHFISNLSFRFFIAYTHVSFWYEKSKRVMRSQSSHDFWLTMSLFFGPKEVNFIGYLCLATSLLLWVIPHLLFYWRQPWLLSLWVHHHFASSTCVHPQNPFHHFLFFVFLNFFPSGFQRLTAKSILIFFSFLH